MDLGDWGDIAEISGNLMIVFSLLFVGREIAHNTKQAQADSDNYIGDSLRQINLHILADEKLSSLIAKAHGRSESLTDAESLRYHTYLRLHIDTWELAWERYRDKLMSEENWDDWNSYFVGWARENLTGINWQTLKWEYNSGLVERIDSILENQE